MTGIIFDVIKGILPHFPMLIHSLFSMTKAHFKKLWEELPWLGCAIMAAVIGIQSHRLDNRNIQIADMQNRAMLSTANWMHQVMDLSNKRQDLTARIEQSYLEGKQHAQRETQRIIDGLRAGNIRMRRELTANATPMGPNKGASPQSTAGHHGTASSGLHEKDGEFLIRFAADADSITRELQQCQQYVKGLESEKAICFTPAHH